MAIKNLQDLFYDELRDIYHAEMQLLKALPKMAKAASSEKLRQAFESHLEETQRQVERIETAFQDTGKAPRAKKCEAMEGLLKEASSCMEEDMEPHVMDAVLIACAQKVEHYEIATYGTLCTWARLLEYDNALAQLKETINEEENADKKLTQLSQKINVSANV